MFRLRLTSDCHARTKNGQPPHNTIGVASKNSIQLSVCIEATRSSGRPGTESLMAMIKSGTVSTTPIQNRLVMSTSSGFASSAIVTVRSSSAMPQIGQAPGWSRTICGCIGQVYSPLPIATGSGCCAARFKKRAGSLPKTSRQWPLQKKYLLPSCSNEPAAVCLSTVIPQTGSIAQSAAFTLSACRAPCTCFCLSSSMQLQLQGCAIVRRNRKNFPTSPGTARK